MELQGGVGFIELILAVLLALGNMVGATEELPKQETVVVETEEAVNFVGLSEYQIDVELKAEENKLFAKQSIEYQNTENVDLKEIYLHIYPNAYLKRETCPAENIAKVYPNGFDVGSVEFNEITLNKEKASYEIEGKDKSLLKINLKEALKPGEQVMLNFDYEVKIPNAESRFGHAEEFYNLATWYPIVCVYDDEGWNNNTHSKMAEAFYSDTSNYKVSFKLPKDYKVAHTGELLKEEILGDQKILEIDAPLVRDFAMVASPHFIVEEIEGEGVDRIKLYLHSDSKKLKQEYEEATLISIKSLEALFGEYPHKDYSVVSTPFSEGGGMEFSQLVYIDKAIGEQSTKIKAKNGMLQQVITHETAHQWWFATVGNDQYDEGWLDESVTSFSEELCVYQNAIEKYDEEEAMKRYKAYHEAWHKSGYMMMNPSFKDKRMARRGNEFNNFNEYGVLLYAKGPVMFYEISDKYGIEHTIKALRKYYEENKFKIGNREILVNCFKDVMGEEVEDIFNKYLDGEI